MEYWEICRKSSFAFLWYLTLKEYGNCVYRTRENIATSQNAALSTSHGLSRCQVGITKQLCMFCHKLSFLRILSFLVLSQFEFCHILNFLKFYFSHNLIFLGWSQFSCLKFFSPSKFEIPSFVTFFFYCYNFNTYNTIHTLYYVRIWIFQFCHNLGFWVVPIFKLLNMLSKFQKNTFSLEPQ